LSMKKTWKTFSSGDVFTHERWQKGGKRTRKKSARSKIPGLSRKQAEREVSEVKSKP